MYLLIKILIVLSLLQWSLSCNPLHYKFVNRKINKKNNSKYPWLVAIRNNHPNIIFRLGYGSIIHPKAVLTAALVIDRYKEDELIIETKCKDFRRSLNPSNELFIYGCTTRHVIKIIYPDNFYRNENLETSYAMLILKTPFTISTKIYPILVAKHTNMINKDNCVFIRWMREWSRQNYRAGIVTTPYNTTFYNQTVDFGRFGRRQLRTDRDWIVGGTFHMSHADKYSVIPLNFIGSPLVCQLENEPERFAQVGIATFSLSVYVMNNETDSIRIQQKGSIINIIDHKYDILEKLIRNVC